MHLFNLPSLQALKLSSLEYFKAQRVFSRQHLAGYAGAGRALASFPWSKIRFYFAPVLRRGKIMIFVSPTTLGKELECLFPRHGRKFAHFGKELVHFGEGFHILACQDWARQGKIWSNPLQGSCYPSRQPLAYFCIPKSLAAAFNHDESLKLERHRIASPGT